MLCGGLSDSAGATVSLSTSDGMVLAVVLTTASAGRFSKNVLTLVPGVVTTIEFLPWEEGGDFDLGEFKRTLRVQHLQQNL